MSGCQLCRRARLQNSRMISTRSQFSTTSRGIPSVQALFPTITIVFALMNSECEWTIFNVQILKERWHVFFLSCVCCWSHQPLEANGLGLHPLLRAVSLNLSLLEALGVWIARRLSVSVHHRHRQSGHLLIHNESPVFIARHCYLIQLIEAFCYLLLVSGLKARVIRECSPVMPDLGTWFGEPETHSYTHGDPTEQNVLYGSAFRMQFLSFFLTLMWSNWRSIPVARSWISEIVHWELSDHCWKVLKNLLHLLRWCHVGGWVKNYNCGYVVARGLSWTLLQPGPRFATPMQRWSCISPPCDTRSGQPCALFCALHSVLQESHQTSLFSCCACVEGSHYKRHISVLIVCSDQPGHFLAGSRSRHHNVLQKEDQHHHLLKCTCGLPLLEV